MNCTICGYRTKSVGKGAYYLKNRKLFSTIFFYCQNCNSFIREVDENDIVSHLKAASHTNLFYERRFFQERIGYYKFLLAIIKKHNKTMTTWLDFGCSYGHFMSYLKTKAIDCEGVEIAEKVQEYTRNFGFKVYQRLSEIEKMEKYDVISLLDSIYYHKNPNELIAELKQKIKPNGILLVRITNRNWLVKLKLLFFKNDFGNLLGDATIGYSKKSIIYLLEQNGFKLEQISGFEIGKKLSLKKQLFYYCTFIVYLISFKQILITPGIVLIARKT